MRITFDRCNKGLFLKVHRYTIVYYNCGSLRKFSLILENMTWSVYGIICFSILAGRTHLDATITSENIFRGALVFLQMIHNKKLFREPSVKYRTFSEDPTWSDLKLKSRLKLSKNYSIHGKNREIFGPHNFWTPIKSNIPDFWNWNCWTLFGLEIAVATPLFNINIK